MQTHRGNQLQLKVFQLMRGRVFTKKSGANMCKLFTIRTRFKRERYPKKEPQEQILGQSLTRGSEAAFDSGGKG
ncbi:hypothetical protein HMPREF1862_00204 [Varibaculum cambriense]|uniref:Uncharacterized protein n=1 Tax=Varibaculum cambriense TaxID=184870 RepID=A0AB34X414_9ACTO|nr:hypothetical protein HMPREF1862_00204 [Varibaculum cambriense]PMB88921.1 hypothetical protein CJ240_07870 [Varibaculum cambriense]